MPLKIITTSDGSHSLFNEELNETYHSHHGAIQESNHVFINQGLEFVIKAIGLKAISILEIGFGTGLNAFLTLQRVHQAQTKITYTSIDSYPLTEDIWSALNYSSLTGNDSFYRALHEATWGKPVLLQENFELLKLLAPLQTIALPSQNFDLVYYDAFAPSKQPELWSMQMLEKVASAMRVDGVFVTYCAKGELKRNLKQLGFTVETLHGPPGKKEMVRATKLPHSL